METGKNARATAKRKQRKDTPGKPSSPVKNHNNKTGSSNEKDIIGKKVVTQLHNHDNHTNSSLHHRKKNPEQTDDIDDENENIYSKRKDNIRLKLLSVGIFILFVIIVMLLTHLPSDHDDRPTLPPDPTPPPPMTQTPPICDAKCEEIKRLDKALEDYQKQMKLKKQEEEKKLKASRKKAEEEFLKEQQTLKELKEEEERKYAEKKAKLEKEFDDLETENGIGKEYDFQVKDHEIESERDEMMHQLKLKEIELKSKVSSFQHEDEMRKIEAEKRLKEEGMDIAGDDFVELQMRLLEKKRDKRLQEIEDKINRIDKDIERKSKP